MLILIFSDTHGDRDAFDQMMDQVQTPDHIFCLGDSGFSKDMLDQKNIVSVKGNYPFAPKNPYDMSEKFYHRWFLFTHGHKYSVKFGLSKLIRRAHQLKMDVVCFGHTHQYHLKKAKNLIVLNPGALSFSRCHLFPSYAKIMIDETSLHIQIINLKTQEVIKEIHEVNHE